MQVGLGEVEAPQVGVSQIGPAQVGPRARRRSAMRRSALASWGGVPLAWALNSSQFSSRIRRSQSNFATLVTGSVPLFLTSALAGPDLRASSRPARS